MIHRNIWTVSPRSIVLSNLGCLVLCFFWKWDFCFTWSSEHGGLVSVSTTALQRHVCTVRKWDEILGLQNNCICITELPCWALSWKKFRPKKNHCWRIVPYQDSALHQNVAPCESENVHLNRYLIKVMNANDEWLLAWILQGLVQECSSSQAQSPVDC